LALATPAFTNVTGIETLKIGGAADNAVTLGAKASADVGGVGYTFTLDDSAGLGGLMLDGSAMTADLKVLTGAGTDAIVGGSGNDTFFASLGNDIFTGGAGSIPMKAGCTSDRIPAMIRSNARHALELAKSPSCVCGIRGAKSSHCRHARTVAERERSRPRQLPNRSRSDRGAIVANAAMAQRACMVLATTF
jgi:hypothetical protein